MYVVIEVYGGIIESVTMISKKDEATGFADRQAEASRANPEKDDIRVFAFEDGVNAGVACYSAPMGRDAEKCVCSHVRRDHEEDSENCKNESCECPIFEEKQ